MIACTDWIEENIFELTYILYSYERKLQILVKTNIDRESAMTNTIIPLWTQAETFEREIHEMYGIEFNGNNRLTEFMLEDWKFMPPLRRDFDTVEFVNQQYDVRPGREDAKDADEYTKIKKEKKKKLKELNNTEN